jgi:glycosyltransferase involved in cell wall biosynthesis
MAAIDVLLPTRDVLEFLPRSLDSVLSQTFKDWRLLVLDHGSTDGTLELVEQYASRDERIVIRSVPEANGLGDLLNRGIERADGKILVRQDGDDISHPTRFKRVLDEFQRDPDLLVAGSDTELIDAKDQLIGYTRYPSNSDAIKASVFFRNPFAHSSTAICLEKLNRIDARYGQDVMGQVSAEESIEVHKLAEDYFFLGQLSIMGKCKNIREALVQYRYHDLSESRLKRKQQIDCAKDISRFLARSFAATVGGKRFDPVPFCTHAECIFDFGIFDFSEEFTKMAETMQQGLVSSSDLDRELAYRNVLATRSSFLMGRRYVEFCVRYGWRDEEYRVVRNWLARFVTTRYVIPVQGGVAH